MRWHDYLVTPQAPLVFKSGRPFGAGVRDGANFPWPSSIAGLLRSEWMQTLAADGPSSSGDALRSTLLESRCSGPFLVKETAGVRQLMVPRPSDAVYLQPEYPKASNEAYRLSPQEPSDDCGSDLPEGLWPVGFSGQAPKGKPCRTAAFWTLDELLRWRGGEGPAFNAGLAENDLWCKSLRTQVAIDPQTYRAKDGALLQMEGIDLGFRCQDGRFSDVRYHFGARFSEVLPAGMVCLGGRRRMSWMEPETAGLFALPEKYREKLAKAMQNGLCLTLATPGLFDGGWKPGWLGDGKEGNEGTPPGCKLRLRLRGAAIERWQPLSGWDLWRKQPKPTRKMVPAGSVYWFEVLSGEAAELENLWLSSVCDQEQDRRDGFGIVLPGSWK